MKSNRRHFRSEKRAATTTKTIVPTPTTFFIFIHQPLRTEVNSQLRI